ncbi:retrotransposon unclassified [Hordeum vulgare]|nr:retrotransposon unclassified [Hordeum vulgare]
MSVAQYCRRLQQLANAMADVGELVSDRSLTLQLVRGLSRRFHVMATLLPMQQPFPSFVRARSRLLLEETGLTERERAIAASTLTSGHAGGSSSSGSASTDPSPPSSPHDKGKSPISGDR